MPLSREEFELLGELMKRLGPTLAPAREAVRS